MKRGHIHATPCILASRKRNFENEMRSRHMGVFFLLEMKPQSSQSSQMPVPLLHPDPGWEFSENFLSFQKKKTETARVEGDHKDPKEEWSADPIKPGSSP